MELSLSGPIRLPSSYFAISHTTTEIYLFNLHALLTSRASHGEKASRSFCDSHHIIV